MLRLFMTRLLLWKVRKDFAPTQKLAYILFLQLLWRKSTPSGFLRSLMSSVVNGTFERLPLHIDWNWRESLPFYSHNMRFFAANQQTPVDRTGNLPPGTVVDTTVTNPYLFVCWLLLLSDEHSLIPWSCRTSTSKLMLDWSELPGYVLRVIG